MIKPLMFENPYLMCARCKHRVPGVSGKVNLFCEHVADIISRCPSWTPADGCTCSPTCTIPTVAKHGVVT